MRAKEVFEHVPKSYKTATLILTFVAIVLIIGSFFVPPLGVIDGSVLAATGELFAFSALWVGIGALEKGYDTTIKRGEVEVKISDGVPENDN